MEENKLTEELENESYTLTEKIEIIISSIYSFALWGFALYILGKILQVIILSISGYEINFYLLLGIEIFIIVISTTIIFLWLFLDKNPTKVEEKKET